MEEKLNYKEMRKVHIDTTPVKDIKSSEPPVECIDPDSDQYVEERSQMEVEIERDKKGVLIIDTKRPPTPKIKTDTTRYRKITVSRKANILDGKIQEDVNEYSLEADREMKAYAKNLKIPKKIGVFMHIRKKVYDFYCKISKLALNIKRKTIKLGAHKHKDHALPSNIRTIGLTDVQQKDLDEMGRQRSFKRRQDETPNMINAVSNKKTGVVVMTPNVNAYRASVKNPDDFEVVESQIKDTPDLSEVLF